MGKLPTTAPKSPCFSATGAAGFKHVAFRLENDDGKIMTNILIRDTKIMNLLLTESRPNVDKI
jgi:hypothetical protein